MNQEEFINYHEVDLLSFQKYIESIGFEKSSLSHFFRYKSNGIIYSIELCFL